MNQSTAENLFHRWSRDHRSAFSLAREFKLPVRDVIDGIRRIAAETQRITQAEALIGQVSQLREIVVDGAAAGAEAGDRVARQALADLQGVVGQLVGKSTPKSTFSTPNNADRTREQQT